MVDALDQTSGLVGIEISTHALCLAVVRGGDVIRTESFPVADPDESVQELVHLVEKLKNDIPGVVRVGIAIPGLVDRSTRRVAYSAHIPVHSDVDIANIVKTATGVETVIENDANAAAFGEYKLGAGRGGRNLFYATLGEGIGGALIIDGTLWRGVAGYAGEFGFFTINSEGTRLEEVASSNNIIRRTRSRFHQDSTSSLNKLDEEAISLKEIIAAAKRDDDFAQMMLKRTGTYVGTAIASVINLLNIEKIVIGGRIMEAESIVLDAITERARELSFEPSFNSSEIVKGELGENAAAIGAALIGSVDFETGISAIVNP